jgi:hypothetical protein
VRLVGVIKEQLVTVEFADYLGSCLKREPPAKKATSGKTVKQ